MKKRLDIFTNHYFPFHFIALGIAFILLGILVSLMNPVISIILLVFGVLFTTTHYRLRIDVDNRKYWEYLFILGFKKGEEKEYSTLDYIFINQLKEQSGYGFVTRVNISKYIYKGFIHVANDDSIFIGSSKKEEKAVKTAKKIADFLQIEVEKNY